MNKVIYINLKGSCGVETVDEFPYNNKAERLEAHKMLKEYCLSDSTNFYFLSNRATKDWRNK